MRTKVQVKRSGRNKNRPWTVRWFLEPDPTTGKQPRPCKSFRTKAEAERFALDLTVAFSQGQRRSKPKEVGLKQFCRDFRKANRHLRPETINLYENAERRLLDHFGPKYSVSKITPQQAELFIASLTRLDGKDGDLSDWARHRALRNCKTMFETAVNWELIVKNPFSKVKAPKCRTRPWHYLKPDEFAAMLAKSSLREKATYSLAYCCGLRLGEFLSLKWTCLDFDAAEVKIQNRPAAGKHPPFFVKDAEARTIPVPQHCLNILADLKGYNDMTDETPYVALDGGQYRTAVAKWQRFRETKTAWRNQDMQNNTLTTFKRRIRQAEIEPTGTLSLHTLRKCCIQNWANHISNPEVVRVLAGHSDLKTTMRYYAQASRDQREKAAAAIDKLLSGCDV